MFKSSCKGLAVLVLALLIAGCAQNFESLFTDGGAAATCNAACSIACPDGGSCACAAGTTPTACNLVCEAGPCFGSCSLASGCSMACAPGAFCSLVCSSIEDNATLSGCALACARDGAAALKCSDDTVACNAPPGTCH